MESPKEKADALFKAADYAAAVEWYGKALEVDAGNSRIWNNRANARQKMEENGLAIQDATKAIELDPSYVKAYYRRALCKVSILHFSEAISDFKTILKLDPSNAVVSSQLSITTKIHRKIEFEKAIAVDDAPTISSTVITQIKDGAVEVEANYQGPKLPKNDAGEYECTKDFITEMIAWFKAGKYLHRRFAWEIILGAQRRLLAEPTLVNVPVASDCKINILGDVHGQMYDLLHIFELTGEPSEKNLLLFNGDFVDRGSWSTEVILILFAWKWMMPNSFFLNRGNHEAAQMNSVYGFEGEVKHKYTEMTYKLFTEVFTNLPLATLIEPAEMPVSTTEKDILTADGKKRYFVVHGGLFSKDNVTLDDIRSIQRHGKQPGQEGIFCELLWTDPQEANGRGPSKRGVGIAFGPDITEAWCRHNQVTGIFRSHEVRQGGYAIEHDGRCTTVFSAPNYCDAQGNMGAIIGIDSRGTLSYKTFTARPHPNIKPMAYSSGFGGGMI